MAESFITLAAALDEKNSFAESHETTTSAMPSPIFYSSTDTTSSSRLSCLATPTPLSPPPPAYYRPESFFPTFETCHARPLSSQPDELPRYTKFAEKSRAERCFWYGFILVPIWFWGFLHYWSFFSQAVPGSSIDIKTLTELPQWRSSVPPLHISPPNDTSSAPPLARPASFCLPTSLSINRPDIRKVWRKEEKKWALRCGYAMGCWWSLMILFLVIAMQSGALSGFSS